MPNKETVEPQHRKLCTMMLEGLVRYKLESDPNLNSFKKTCPVKITLASGETASCPVQITVERKGCMTANNICLTDILEERLKHS
jgi:hypothetical protein